RQLCAAATIPCAQEELEIARALPLTRAPQFRGHDNPGASKSQRATVVAREGLESTKRSQSPSPGRSPPRLTISWNAESIRGDHQKTGRRHARETAVVQGRDLRGRPAKCPRRGCTRQNRICARTRIDCVKIK